MRSLKMINGTNYAEWFDKDRTVNDMNNVVNGFSNLFINVGPKLTEEIHNLGFCLLQFHRSNFPVKLSRKWL